MGPIIFEAAVIGVVVLRELHGKLPSDPEQVISGENYLPVLVGDWFLIYRRLDSLDGM